MLPKWKEQAASLLSTMCLFEFFKLCSIKEKSDYLKNVKILMILFEMIWYLLNQLWLLILP